MKLMKCKKCGSDNIVYLSGAERYHCNDCGIVGKEDDFIKEVEVDEKVGKCSNCKGCKCSGNI